MESQGSLGPLGQHVHDFAKDVRTYRIDLHDISPSTVACQGQDCVIRKNGSKIEIRTKDAEIVDVRRVLTLHGHSDIVWSVAVSSDRRHIVSGSADKTVKMWSLQSGQCVRTLQGYSGGVRSVAVSPDGQHIVSAGYNHGDDDDDDDENHDPNEENASIIKVWSVQSGQCVHTLQAHSQWMQNVVVSPDGQHIVSCVHDGTIKIWSLQSGQCLRTLQGHTDSVFDVAVCPDGQNIVSGSADGVIKIWSLQSGQCLRTLQGHIDYVQSVAVCPDGQHIVSGCGDSTIKVWSLQSGQCVHTLQGHTSGINSVAVSPDGQHIVSCGGDKTIKVWSLQSGQCVHTLQGHTGGAISIATGLVGQHIASAGCEYDEYGGIGEYTVKVWSLQSGQCLASFDRKNIDDSFALTIVQWHDGTEIGIIQDNGQIIYVTLAFDTSDIGDDHSSLSKELLQAEQGKEGIISRIDRSTPLLSALVLLDKTDLLRSILSTLSSECGDTVPSDILDARGEYTVSGSSSTAVYERPTALHYALLLGRSECAQILLEHGASIHACQSVKMPNDKQLLSIPEPVRKQCMTFLLSRMSL